MPNHFANIPLDNYVQNGEVTLNELINSVSAVNGGTKPGVAQKITDISTGKLVHVQLTFPSTVSTNAVAAINANNGVPITVVAAAPQLQVTDLHSASGIIYAGTLLPSPDAGISDGQVIHATLDVFNELGSNLGSLYSPSNSTEPYVGYYDLDSFTTAGPLLLKFAQQGGIETDFVIPQATSLKVKLGNGSEISIIRNGDITVPAQATPAYSNWKEYYVAQDGKLYLRNSSTNGVYETALTYEQAIQNPAA